MLGGGPRREASSSSAAMGWEWGAPPPRRLLPVDATIPSPPPPAGGGGAVVAHSGSIAPLAGDPEADLSDAFPVPPADIHCRSEGPDGKQIRAPRRGRG